MLDSRLGPYSFLSLENGLNICNPSFTRGNTAAATLAPVSTLLSVEDDGNLTLLLGLDITGASP
jgi:hypothetical protein